MAPPEFPATSLARSSFQTPTWQQRMQLLMDVGLMGVIFLAPLAMGGRGPIGKFVFVACVSLAVVAWALRQILRDRAGWRWSGVELLLLAAAGLVVLQIVPLPAALLYKLSPHIESLLPLWTSDSLGFPVWETLSLDPAATRSGLVVLLGYCLLFLVLVQRIDTLADVRVLCQAVALSAMLLAVLGMVQFLVGNGKFLWVFQHPSRDTSGAVKSVFQNQNHLAHLFALSIGPAIYWFWTSPTKSWLRHSLAIGIGFLAMAGLFTFSRGGVVVLILVSGLALAMLFHKSIRDYRLLTSLVALAGLLTMAVAIYGYEPLAHELRTIRQADSMADLSQARLALWSALWDASRDFPWLGTGIGTHREIYPIYLDQHFGMEFTHGESGYVQLFLEAGSVGLLLFLLGASVVCFWCVAVLRYGGRSVRGRDGQRKRAKGVPEEKVVCGVAILPGLVASLTHSIGDFVWYISTCMSFTVILAACACRLYQLSSADTSSDASGRGLRRFLAAAPASYSRQLAGACAAVVALLVAGMLHASFFPAAAAPHWYAYLRKSQDDSYEHQLEDGQAGDRLFTMSQHLEEALRWHPGSARLNSRYASVCLRRFELEQRSAVNPLALAQIRDAAVASQFPSKQALDAWLSVAIGENVDLLNRALHHCQLGLRACPVQGEAYIYFADLGFLLGMPEAVRPRLLDQALRVRPHSGPVLFAAGQQSALTADLNKAIEQWKRAIRQDPRVQSLVISTLAERLPAALFLEFFDPDFAGLAELYRHYRDRQRLDDAILIGQAYAKELEIRSDGPDLVQASSYLNEARDVYDFMGDYPSALRCAQRAVELAPNDYSRHRALARQFVQTQQYAEAAREFQWCLRRRPNDPKLSQRYAEVKRLSLRPRQRSAAGSF